MFEDTQIYVWDQIVEIYRWAKCGESPTSLIPTVMWAMGVAILAHRLLNSMFKRFLFRRTPLWEIVFQDLLFLWLFVYSLQFWKITVKTIAIVVELCHQDILLTPEEKEYAKFAIQWLVWMISTLPLVVCVLTMNKQEQPPVIIWIPVNPWQRREMGPQGYYLHRPLSTDEPRLIPVREYAMDIRGVCSDSRIDKKLLHKRRRCSKSV